MIFDDVIIKFHNLKQRLYEINPKTCCFYSKAKSFPTKNFNLNLNCNRKWRGQQVASCLKLLNLLYLSITLKILKWFVLN